MVAEPNIVWGEPGHFREKGTRGSRALALAAGVGGISREEAMGSPGKFNPAIFPNFTPPNHTMETIHFDKSLCGVDFLVNVGSYQDLLRGSYPQGVHNTDFFEVLLVHQAEGFLDLNQSRIPLRPGQVIFITQFQQRRWNVDINHLDATFLVFQEDFLNEFFADYLFSFRLLYFYQSVFPLHLDLAPGEFDRMLEILAEIRTELKQPKVDSAHIIRSLLYYLLMRLNRLYTEFYEVEVGVSQNNHAFRFRRLLERHIRSKQRLDDYTELLGVSRVTLNKATKAQFNTTASELIKQRLLFEIKNQLIYSSRTINEIADDLGFSEPNHLTRFFRNREGMPPSEYQVGFQNGRLMVEKGR